MEQLNESIKELTTSINKINVTINKINVSINKINVSIDTLVNTLNNNPVTLSDSEDEETVENFAECIDDPQTAEDFLSILQSRRDQSN